MVIALVVSGYLLLAACFYLYLTRTATDVFLPMQRRQHKWLRPRRLHGVNILRRLRPLLSLRLPKHSRKD